MLEPEKIIEHAQNFFLGPTFEQKRCKMFTECYINAMKSLTSLGYRSQIVRQMLVEC